MEGAWVTINGAVGAAFDAVFGLMEAWPGWASLLALSAVTGVLALLAFKYTSNQDAIGKVRDDFKAALLSLKLFKDEISVTFAAIGRMFWAGLRLLGLSLVPFAVMLVPMVLLIVQMAMRYEWRPLRPGERTVLCADLRPGTPHELAELACEAPEGLALEIPVEGCRPAPVPAAEDRPERNFVCWRLRAQSPGAHRVVLRIDEQAVEKEVRVSENAYAGVSPVRPARRWTDILFYPRESPPDEGAIVQRVTVDFPAGSTPIFGWDIHWLISYFVLSMVLALILKPILRVKL